jgi:diguanylate cyclase (GGDEF)-like protein
VPIALLMIDLDGFARVNDDCGRLAGDVVLQRCATVIRSCAGPADVVARWGADQFVVVTELDTADAARLADRIRLRIRDCGDPGSDDTVTASSGIAVRRAPEPEDRWLRRVELALHQARRLGGDTVATAPGEGVDPAPVPPPEPGGAGPDWQPAGQRAGW